MSALAEAPTLFDDLFGRPASEQRSPAELEHPRPVEAEGAATVGVEAEGAAAVGIEAEAVTAAGPGAAGVQGAQTASSPNEQAGPTLDAVLSSRWQALLAHENVACLVCGEAMAPEYGVHAMPIGGRCQSCGTVLQ